MLSMNAFKSITLLALIGVAVILRCGPGHDIVEKSLAMSEQLKSTSGATGATRLETVQVTVGGANGRLEHVMILLFHPSTKPAAETDAPVEISL